MAAAAIHVAIVGSGPSGFYAAESVLDTIPGAQVDMFERLPTPFGLVRSGVAPDHPKLKEVTSVFDRIMRSERFRFIGNVEIGPEVGIATLRAAYHAVVLAYGASGDRKMGIPGEGLTNCHSATEFVGWYNGHPDFRDLTFDLSQEVAVVVGHGNVAADVCRILLQPAAALRVTDIASHALQALAESRVREVHLVGRRGPAQAKFTPKEFRGLCAIPSCTAMSDHGALNAACEHELADRLNINAKKNVECLRTLPSLVAVEGRTLSLRFLMEPEAIEGKGRVERFVFRRTQLEGKPFQQRPVATGETVVVPCGLVFTSIGYRGSPVGDVPFDERSATVPSDRGRVCVNGNDPPGLYVTGWLKRGPTGIIGTNRADSIETVQRIVEDLAALATQGKRGFEDVKAKVQGHQIIDLTGWDAIDASERSHGAAAGKPREKFTRIAEMLACAAPATEPPMAKGFPPAGTRQSFETGTPSTLASVRS